MTKTVVKGLHFTKVISHRKGAFLETVQMWILAKPRKIEDCGVWVDGKKLRCE